MKRSYGMIATLLALTLAVPAHAGEEIRWDLTLEETRNNEIFPRLISEEPLLDPRGPKYVARELLEFSLVSKQFQSFFAPRLDALKEELAAWHAEAMKVALDGKGEPAYLSGRYPDLLAIQVRHLLAAKSQQLQRDPRARDKLGYGLLLSASPYIAQVWYVVRDIAQAAAFSATFSASDSPRVAAWTAAFSAAQAAAAFFAAHAAWGAADDAVWDAADDAVWDAAENAAWSAAESAIESAQSAAGYAALSAAQSAARSLTLSHVWYSWYPAMRHDEDAWRAAKAAEAATQAAARSAAWSAAINEPALHAEKDVGTRGRIAYRIAEREVSLVLLRRTLLLPDGRRGALPLAFEATLNARLPAEEQSIFRSPEAWKGFRDKHFPDTLPSTAKALLSPFLDALDEIAAGKWDGEQSEADE